MDSQKEHVFKNVVFLRNHQIHRHQVTIFALETLYRWPFPDAENDHMYSVCDAKTSLGVTVFDHFQKKHELENKHFLDSVKISLVS